MKKGLEIIKPLLKDRETESKGTIIMATGYDPFDPRLKPEFGYGLYKNVMTGLEFERLLSASGPTQGKIQINGKEPKNVVFIQCVGSRDKTIGNEYCSRVCCMYTAKQASLIKDQIPAARVTICYIDIRAFGKGCEQFYDKVQRKGVLYRKGIPSEIYQRSGKLVVKADDELVGEPYEEEADLVVLATGLTQRNDSDRVRSLLKLSQSPDRFYMEAHPKLRPLDTATDGIFLAGACQGPKDIPYSVSQGSGAAARAATVLSQPTWKIEPIIAVVDPRKCKNVTAKCGLCVTKCPYGAIKADEKQTATVTAAMCHGCGTCVAECPKNCITQYHFHDLQILVLAGFFNSSEHGSLLK